MSLQPKESDRSSTVVDSLLESYQNTAGAMQHVNSYELPSMDEVAKTVEQCRELIFPGFVGRSLVRATPTELRAHVRERVSELSITMRRQLYRSLHHKIQLEKGTQELECAHCATRAEEITEQLLERLSDIRAELALDVEAHYLGDPAASGTDEIIFCYPGLYVITVYRLASTLMQLGAKLIPRMMTEHAHEKTGIDIHPGATIGRSFFIDHGNGVVIGETTVIGDRVRVYQGVTFGAMSVKKRPEQEQKRHPTIEDDVVIYSGATILGGDTVIGRGAIIGGNCWVTESVPAGSIVTQDGTRLKKPS